MFKEVINSFAISRIKYVIKIILNNITIITKITMKYILIQNTLSYNNNLNNYSNKIYNSNNNYNRYNKTNHHPSQMMPFNKNFMIKAIIIQIISNNNNNSNNFKFQLYKI